LIERAELGGTCLNWGCIPTKALLAAADLLRKIREAKEFGILVGEVGYDFAAMMARKEDIVGTMRGGVQGACERKGVAVVKGQGVVDGDAVVVDGTRYEYDHLVVATGTEPAGLPGIDMDHPAVLTSNDILVLPEVPETLLILGAGVIGCEFASLFQPLGVKVTMVEMLPRILAGIDNRTAKQFQKFLEKDGAEIHLGRRLEEVTSYSDAGVTVKLDDGTEISAEKMLISIGRRPQTNDIGLAGAGVVVNERGHIEVDEFLRTANPKVWAVGDCIGGMQLAHLASAEGARAAENILGPHQVPMDRTVVPACIYTHPEIATVGLNRDTAEEQGITIKVGQARFAGSGKALGEGESDGFAQLIADADTDLLLGATIMGAHAVEMIHEVGVAISDGYTMRDLGEIIHAHPTISEMVMDAAQQGEGVAPYLS
jgi:dihydrolipoamide dehydrogenase